MLETAGSQCGHMYRWKFYRPWDTGMVRQNYGWAVRENYLPVLVTFLHVLQSNICIQARYRVFLFRDNTLRI